MFNLLEVRPFNAVSFWLRCLQIKLFRWAAKRPVLTILIVLAISVIALPVVMVGALTPVAMLFTYTEILTSRGGTYIIYNILFQGFLLASLMVALFVVLLGITTFASIVHSYKFFYAQKNESGNVKK